MTASGHAPAPECPRSPTGAHDRYSDGVCCHCRNGVTPPTSETTRAFREGEALAYRRVLALLDGMPEDEATPTRDHGRGVAHAAGDIRRAVLDLAFDAGVSI